MRSPRRPSTSDHSFSVATVFPGHTEFLAHLTGSEEYAMAFVAANLRIVLISTHVPLAEAIRLVERDRIVRTISLAHRELKRWGIEQPRIAVAALNPHGAEGGLFGMEETSEISPAIEACRSIDELMSLALFRPTRFSCALRAANLMRWSRAIMIRP